MGSDFPSLDLIYKETREALIRSLAIVDTLDTKASALASLDGLVVTTLLAALWTVFSDPSRSRLLFHDYPLSLLLVVISVIGAFASLVLALSAYRTRTWKDVLNSKLIYEEYLEKEEGQTKHQILVNMIDADEKNRQILSRKAGLIESALWCLGGTSFLVLAAILTIVIQSFFSVCCS